MKKALLIVFVFSIFCCNREELPDYNSSLEEWNMLKDQNNNSYTYTVSTSSWTGFGTNTVLTIQNGVVISRVFEAYQLDETKGSTIITDSYFETSETLNTNENGFATRTIDDLYDTCIEDYLSVNKKDNTIFFETDDTGIISQCGFVPDDCADDCLHIFLKV